MLKKLWYYIVEFLFTFSNLQALCFYLVYFIELLDVEHGSPISQKMSNEIL